MCAPEARERYTSAAGDGRKGQRPLDELVGNFSGLATICQPDNLSRHVIDLSGWQLVR